jgi:hypothetical protein
MFQDDLSLRGDFGKLVLALTIETFMFSLVDFQPDLFLGKSEIKKIKKIALLSVASWERNGK